MKRFMENGNLHSKPHPISLEIIIELTIKLATALTIEHSGAPWVGGITSCWAAVGGWLDEDACHGDQHCATHQTVPARGAPTRYKDAAIAAAIAAAR